MPIKTRSPPEKALAIRNYKIKFLYFFGGILDLYWIGI
jgi:hypothetical protein